MERKGGIIENLQLLLHTQTHTSDAQRVAIVLGIATHSCLLICGGTTAAVSLENAFILLSTLVGVFIEV